MIKYLRETVSIVLITTHLLHDEKEAKSNAPILLEAQKMLIDWESGNQQVYELWTKMNNWVYDGFNSTYKNLKVSFDKLYYESNTYQIGKEIVKNGVSFLQLTLFRIFLSIIFGK